MMNLDIKLSLQTAKYLIFNSFSVFKERFNCHDCLQKSIYDLKKIFSKYLNNLKIVYVRKK